LTCADLALPDAFFAVLLAGTVLVVTGIWAVTGEGLVVATTETADTFGAISCTAGEGFSASTTAGALTSGAPDSGDRAED
jgi:hypothetical protein